MKKIFRKTVALVMSLGLSMSVITGCSSSDSNSSSGSSSSGASSSSSSSSGTIKSNLKIKDTKYEITDDSGVIFDLGKSTITYGEMMYYVAYYEMMGEYMRSYYAEAMGYSGDFWSEVGESGYSEAENYKNNAFQEAYYVEVMKNAAIDEGITLSDDEIAEIEASAKESYEIYSEEIRNRAGITYEGFLAAQKTMAYSSKYVEMLKNEIVESDTYKDALAAIVKEDNLAYEVNYAYISLSSEDSKTEENLAASNALIQDIYNKVSSSGDFVSTQNEYSDNSSVIFGSKVIKKDDSEADAKVLEVLSGLENDEVSEIITTDYGLFVFQMINNKNEEKYQELLTENSESIIESLVTSRYNQLSEEYSIEACEELADSIVMGKMTIN